MNMKGKPMADSKTTRRTVLNTLLGLGGFAAAGSILYPVVAFLMPPRRAESSQFTVTLDKKAGDFQPGDSHFFPIGNKPGMLICEQEGEEKKFYAYSAVCTHLDCVVQYLPDEKKIFCPCHNGSFDINGNNIAGPPPRPLEKFIVQISGDTIKIIKES